MRSRKAGLCALVLLALACAKATPAHTTPNSLLPAPLLDLPADGASTTVPVPHLSWHPVCEPRAIGSPCGGGYDVEIRQCNTSKCKRTRTYL